MYDAFILDWSKNAICDDVVFIAYYINDAIGKKFDGPQHKNGFYWAQTY